MRNLLQSFIILLVVIATASPGCAGNNRNSRSVTTEHYPGEIVNYSYSPSSEGSPELEDPVFQVPDNNILVIDTISIVGNAIGTEGYLYGGVSVSGSSFSFFVTWPWNITDNPKHLADTKRVRIYAEPGSSVRLSCAGTVIECRTAFSGYFVPVRD